MGYIRFIPYVEFVVVAFAIRIPGTPVDFPGHFDLVWTGKSAMADRKTSARIHSDVRFTVY